jgi:hypothetical protein
MSAIGENKRGAIEQRLNERNVYKAARSLHPDAGYKMQKQPGPGNRQLNLSEKKESKDGAYPCTILAEPLSFGQVILYRSVPSTISGIRIRAFTT